MTVFPNDAFFKQMHLRVIHSREMKTQLREFEIVNTKPSLILKIILHFNEHPNVFSFN